MLLSFKLVRNMNINAVLRNFFVLNPFKKIFFISNQPDFELNLFTNKPKKF